MGRVGILSYMNKAHIREFEAHIHQRTLSYITWHLTFIIIYDSGKTIKFQPKIPPKIHAYQHKRLGFAIFTLKSKLIAFARTCLEISTRTNLFGLSLVYQRLRINILASQIFSLLFVTLTNQALSWKSIKNWPRLQGKNPKKCPNLYTHIYRYVETLFYMYQASIYLFYKYMKFFTCSTSIRTLLLVLQV